MGLLNSPILSSEVESQAISLLATAVVAQAFKDLTHCSTFHSQHQKEDAKDFLTRRLWQSESLWRELLGDRVRKSTVLKTVAIFEQNPKRFSIVVRDVSRKDPRKPEA